MTDLVTIINKEPVVSTEALSSGFEIPHRNILFLIKKYEPQFSKLGTLATLSRKSGGKSVRFFMLNEKQSSFLGTLLKNSEITISFKLRLVEEFFRIRERLNSFLTQTRNIEWQEKRQAGKITRKAETDVIKKFVDYAISQGSQSAGFYYANITKMQNKALFLLDQKYPNLRNVLNLNQLSVIECADRVVSNALEFGMAEKMHYKKIYEYAKEQVEAFAKAVGRTVIPQFQLDAASGKKQLEFSAQV